METKERNASFFRFEDLRIYDKAVDYSSWVAKTLNGAATTTSNSTLKDAFLKGTLAICVNIAEGSYRSKTQFEVYLKVAKSAIRECTVYTSVAHKLEIFTDDDYEKSRELLMELTRMLGALIVSLQRNVGRRKENQSSETVQDEETETTSIDVDDESFNLDF
ncbi:MAG: four helix bundle protein [Bacteroidales bacterium]|nr:four helix bundle protein [Bacteroidales bacterium]